MSRHPFDRGFVAGTGQEPDKPALEESIAAALILEPGLDVSIVPYLYDLGPDHTGRLFLESVRGDMVVLGGCIPRAAFWLLDRDGIKGHEGGQPDRSRSDATRMRMRTASRNRPRASGQSSVPDRHIYCLDLRDQDDHRVYVDEVKRIALECRQRREANLKQWIGGQPSHGAAWALPGPG